MNIPNIPRINYKDCPETTLEEFMSDKAFVDLKGSIYVLSAYDKSKYKDITDATNEHAVMTVSVTKDQPFIPTALGFRDAFGYDIKTDDIIVYQHIYLLDGKGSMFLREYNVFSLNEKGEM